MRCIFASLCCVVLVANISAGAKPKPNTLTEKEIRDGWILLFDGMTTFGWEIQGDAKVNDGALVLGGKQKTQATFKTAFVQYKLAMEYKVASDDVRISFQKSSGQTTFAMKFVNAKGWNRFNYSATGNKDSASVFQITVPAGKKLVLRSIKLRPLATKPIFNGKNLAGWKVLPGYKSKYTVTKEGWLNVKNGRGDIQTTDSFKDFVLQLECISLGKHLNSGIFFRCIPGLYQQGYEAQIRNQFTPGEKRVYQLDQYDPKTHKKIGKVKVQSTAVDFGTGGIYRRQPARKGLSKDNEWFNMTVVAHGNHFATWVNGVQVTDWTDNRPVNKNARRGCCLNAGAISIQGHDPTTNLSFRNIRIAAFPNK